MIGPAPTRLAITRTHAPLPVERVLLAEEDDELRSELARELRRDGYVVIEVEDGMELEDYLESASGPSRPFEPPNVIISEATMYGCGGLEVLAHLRDLHSTTPFILLNSTADPAVDERARQLHATCVLEGPVDADELRDAVHLAA